MQLILDRNKSLIVFSSSLLPPKMWVFIYTSCGLSHVISIRFSLICGVMEVLIGNLIELARFVREEEDQWTTVQHHRAGKNRSYASVAKTRADLSGANRIPIGSKTFPQHKVN
jgi:hypothetical protein